MLTVSETVLLKFFLQVLIKMDILSTIQNYHEYQSLHKCSGILHVSPIL